MPGISFRETMSGPFALGATDPWEGERRGREAGTTLSMHATVAIPDLDGFVSDPQHDGEIGGSIDFEPLGTDIPARGGRFALFSPTDDPRMRHMIYELAFEHEGRQYYLAGRKEVRDERGPDLWDDTTTLLVTLHEGSDASGPAIGAGVLRLGPDDLVRLVSTVRVTEARGPAEQASTIARFGRFFMGELWDRYASLAPGASPTSLAARLRAGVSRLVGAVRDPSPASRPPGGRLPEHVVARLTPFSDAQSLRSLHVRTGVPWTWLPLLLRAGAVTLGSQVLFRTGRYRDDDPGGLALVAHESIHVRQYREMGVPRFLARYGVGLVQSRFVHDDHPLEREPEAVQRRAREALAET